jgi:Uma2 family endonuclease
MPTLTAKANPTFRMSHVDWPTFMRFCELADGRRVRLTYDRGELEFITLSPKHERGKKILARFVEALTEELGIDIVGGGSATFRREDLEKGIEPDECFWIEHEADVRDLDEIDLATCPAPDLGLEIEITRTVLDRLGIYAALRVPEIWRYDGDMVRFFRLEADGSYTEVGHSVAFPFLRSSDLNRFLAQAGSMSHTKLLLAFRQWVREQKALGWPD